MSCPKNSHHELCGPRCPVVCTSPLQPTAVEVARRVANAILGMSSAMVIVRWRLTVAAYMRENISLLATSTWRKAARSVTVEEER